jgi:hypothetical protein
MEVIMDEILKFKIWDDETNKMYYDGDKYYPSHFSNNLKSVTGECQITNKGILFWVYETRLSNATNEHFDHQDLYYLKGFHIMQYSNKNSIDDIEIYDGDILLWENMKFIIAFRNGTWMGIGVDGNEIDGTLPYCLFNKSKIIGNIMIKKEF